MFLCYIQVLTHFTDFPSQLNGLYRFKGFVIHLPAVASVYISMPVRSVHMLSRCTAISGH